MFFVFHKNDMLKGMKLLRMTGFIFAFLILCGWKIFAPTVSYADCDPHLYNDSGKYFVQTAKGESCTAGDCDAGPVLLGAQVHACWHAGATKNDPYVSQTTCDDQTIGVQSAIGCIPTKDLPSFLAFFLKWALGLSGGVVLLLLIMTGYSLLTSAGNPEKLQGVKENIVSILTGLILIGFSLVLLQTIGAGILKLPSF